jgi:hypothetical protein
LGISPTLIGKGLVLIPSTGGTYTIKEPNNLRRALPIPFLEGATQAYVGTCMLSIGSGFVVVIDLGFLV